MRPIRVMSFNLRYGTADDGPNAWPYRRYAALEVIRSFTPDLLAVQEALAFQVAEIAQALPSHRSVGVGRDDGCEAGEFAAILYDASRFDLLDSGTFWFSSTPDVPGSRYPGCYHPRICTWASLRDGADRFAIFNTHLDNESEAARLAATAQLLQAIDGTLPSVVAGDFNAGEEDGCIQKMRADDFRDTFRVAHPDATSVGTYHGFGQSIQNQKIDYIWIDDAWNVLEASILEEQVEGIWPSDHHPVTSVIGLHDLVESDG